jgi:plasmid stabilization system protein ParE
MEYEVIVSHRARMDLEEAIEWFNAQQFDLGIDFLLEFYRCLDFLGTFPKSNPIVYKGYHRLLFKQFPYAIFYEIDEKMQQVVVLAIWATRRNPDDLDLKLA